MPGDAGEALVLLQLARRCRLSVKPCQNQLGCSPQGMFLFSSPPVWNAPDCRRVENRATSSAPCDEAGRFEGDYPEQICAEDDRFKARLGSQPESFAECSKRAV